MGRLIDAGLVLDNLSGHLESMKDYDAVKEVINNMPTAYDPDKVVEQLKAASYERYGNDGMGGELVVKLDDVVEITKGGRANV